QAWPVLPNAPVGKPGEVEFFQKFEISARGLVRDALELHGALITLHHSANHQRASAITAKIDDLACGLNSVEDDIKIVRHDEADQGGLRSVDGRNRRVNRQ